MRNVWVPLLLLWAACAPARSTASASSAATAGPQPDILEDVTRTYTVFYEGNPIGEYVYSLEAATEGGREMLRVRRAFTMPEGPVEQMALIDARTFEPIRSASHGAITVDLENVGGRVRGTVGTAGTPLRNMDEPLPEGALLPYMFEAVIAASPLRVGYVKEFQVVNPASAMIESVGVRVLGEETVTVPAGTFDVYRVEITGFEPETAYLRRARPHVPVKQDLASPVSIQLANETGSRE